ncbi:Ferric siderophore transport system, periplasmic binding protein TonB [Indibacter alkaliphilus LW1]|uniref:Ferric siderophore transport system, periplasmic binding protein TonB n=1 Tax=Indibacter alkaliphilus (strain CCUG 57479 / KCTC 22604 / LW1) TaxID=1189612 RepID=S2DN83_INDAL|nr:M56 family metallopeptidase [Indibacter alkaliphilus]EOZ98680.1 Ferric siderophore transport system, periplasmic binding protein TonB [Indibacter alkaliphilus LW1]
MAIWVDYIWQSIFCSAFLYGIYFIFLRNEKKFSFNRIYLLISPLIALILPLINIPVSFKKPNISLEQTELFRALDNYSAPENSLTTYGLPEVMVQSSKLSMPWTFQDYFFLAYLVIVCLLIFRIFWSFIQMRMIKERGWSFSTYDINQKYFLIPTFGLAPIFSFFNKLFWDDTLTLSQQEEAQILEHELTHIKKGHSYDILFYQFLTTAFWFNPMIFLMQNALIDVHEYQADQAILKKQMNAHAYPKLIAKIALRGLDLSIGNYFTSSTTLKRIKMIKKSGQTKTWKIFIIIPLLLMLMALVSMKTESGQNLLQQNFNLEDIKSKLIASQDSLEIGIKVKKLNAPTHYELIGILEEDKLKAQIGELEYEFSNIQTDEDYIKVRGLIEKLRNSSVITKDYGDLKKISTELDIKAQPEIGLVNWFNSLKEQVVLPKKEENLGLLGGNLVVEFIVSREGRIENPSISRSLGGGLEGQLLDLLLYTELGNWTPAVKNNELVDSFQVIFLNFTEAKDPQEPYHIFRDFELSVLDIENGKNAIDTIE